MVATMRQGGTRKRPASAISSSDQDQVQEVKKPNQNSKSPSMIRNATFQMQNMSNGPPYDAKSTSNYTDPTGNYLGKNGTPYYSNQEMQSQNHSENQSTDLVRTQPGNQVLSVNYGYPVTGPEYGSPPPTAENQWQGHGHGQDRYDDLDHRALLAQRMAQTKRKQIPPFVQKLSSFLNENTQNTDLIRWSDSGDSFIVVDEDEFAKTLIPELFKHNNYASFVRQLNMYGFHKKVGLSDNSMRASERKNKNPSEYSNPYFKRGKPNLLWLIHKPKNAPSKGGGKGNNRAKQEDAEEDADDLFPRGSPAPSGLEPIEDGHSGWNGRQPLMLGSTDNRPPPDQLENLRQEMAEIRSNQRKITEMLKQSRRENAQLYGQAKTYHEMHQKHDNSITAILNFLATFYSHNLQGGAPGLDHGHGNIVDVGDDKEQSRLATANQPLFQKRQPLLLKDKASPVQSTGDSKEPNRNQWPEGTFSYPTKPKSPPLLSPAIHEINGDSPSARSSHSPPMNPNAVTDGQMPQQDVLSMLNSTSALNNSNITGPTMDFSEALLHLQTANGQTPLTPSQRQNMLQLMSDEQAKSPQNGNQSNINESNVLASYSPPNLNANLAQISMNAEQLSQIEQSLREQEQRMANMQATIAPLSPSGSIPGVNDQSYGGQNGAHDFDFDSMFKSDDYFNDGGDSNNYNFAIGADLPDFDFGTGTELANGDHSVQGPPQLDVPEDGRVKEMDSSEATSPANTVATMEAEDANDGEQLDQRPTKRRRRG